MQTLDDPESRRVEEHLRRERLVAAASQLVNPVVEAKILEEAAHSRELEVRVRVDQPGEEYTLSEIAVLSVRSVRPVSDEHDASLVLDDASKLDRRTRYRDNPARAIPPHGVR